MTVMPDEPSTPEICDRPGPGADRKIWEMAAHILEEAILFGRNDGIDDLVAAAERLERAKVLTAPV